MSAQSKIKVLKQRIEENVKRVYNSEVFSIYEGIVESVDNINGTINVRVTDLGDTLYEGCRVVTPCSSQTISFIPAYTIGMHVIIGFRMFSLNYPVVLGAVQPPSNVYTPFANDTVTLKVGSGTLVMTPDTITLKCGDSSIILSESGIRLYGTYITANSNDITKDDIGIY